MKLVETWTEIRENLLTFNSYRLSKDLFEREFFVDRIRLGKCFVALETNTGIIFGPSRFVGYVENNIYDHQDNLSKHGWYTNQSIKEILGPCDQNSQIEREYLSLCQQLKIDPANNTRKYWHIPESRDFLAK